MTADSATAQSMTGRSGTGRSPASRLSAPELVPLVAELARRFSSGHQPSRITLPALDDNGRARLADLLGLDRYPAHRARIDVGRLANAIGTEGADGLRAAVEEVVGGPLGDRRAAREAARTSRAALWEHAEAAALTLGLFADPDHARTWVERLADAGVPSGDVASHRKRIDTAVACLRRLPAPATSPLTLTVLAADHTGSAHALDPGRRLARMVLDGLAIAFDLAPPDDAESTRVLWERAGVVPDPLSSTVLALGLGPPGDSALSGYLRAAAADCEPVVLTLRQLQRHPIGYRPQPGAVYVVENPSLIADVADRWDGPPLLCSSGRPSQAVVVAVRQLVASGCTVRQHADLDPVGIDITRWLADRAGTVPWHMDATHYTEAVATRPTTALVGTVGPTPWDPGLQALMQSTGRAVHEEALSPVLLQAMLTTEPGEQR